MDSLRLALQSCTSFKEAHQKILEFYAAKEMNLLSMQFALSCFVEELPIKSIEPSADAFSLFFPSEQPANLLLPLSVLIKYLSTTCHTKIIKFCIDLLEEFFVRFPLVEIISCLECFDEAYSRDFMKLYMSIPARVANVLDLSCRSILLEKPFFTNFSLYFRVEMKSADLKPNSLKFMTILTRKIIAQGFAGYFFMDLTAFDVDYFCQLASSLSSYELEKIINISISNSCNEQSLSLLLGKYFKFPLALKQLCHMVEYDKFSSSFQFPNVLLSFLCENADKPCLVQCTITLASKWSDPVFIAKYNYMQQKLVTKFLLALIKHLTFDVSFVENDVMKGTQKRLDLSEYSIRLLGMIVAEEWSKIFSTANKLDFEIVPDEEVMDLRGLKYEPKVQKDEEKVEERISNMKLDDSLLRYEILPEDYIASNKKIKPPRYLYVCLEMLRSKDDYEKAEIGLSMCPKLIQNATSLMIEEKGIELAKTLLYMQDDFNMEIFEAKRMESMVLIASNAPKSICNYMANEFYSNNISVAQKLDILSVFVESINVLSSSKIESSAVDKSLLMAKYPSCKTKFSSSLIKKKSSNLNNHVPHFFFPLISQAFQNQ